MKENQKAQRQYALAKSGGVCSVCRKPLIDGQMQGAHKIAKTFVNYTKYGTFIIDHPLNIEMVCSLACNQSCNIGNNPGKIVQLIADIARYELRKY